MGSRIHHSGLSRRALFAGAGLTLAGLPAACSRKRGSGIPGYAFIANEEARSVAALDLTAFSVARHIPVDAPPTAVVAHPSRPAVFVLTPQTGAVHEIAVDSLAARRRLKVAPAADAMLLDPDGASLWVLCHEARMLARVDLESWRVTGKVRLPGLAADMDLSRDRLAAISLPAERQIVLVSLAEARILRTAAAGPDPRTVRFRSDGRQVLAGNRGDRTLSVIDTQSGKLVVHLPLAIQPEAFCAKVDGGALFISGAGMDAVAMIFPYRAVVAETVLAGRSPGAMAVTSANSDLLFVANTESGDITVIDIDTARPISLVSVGSRPGHIAITPDDQYALVLNRGSGDVAVIRIAALLGRATRQGPPPLFTLIPVGSKPVAAAVKVTS